MNARTVEERLDGTPIYPVARKTYLWYRTLLRTARSFRLSGSVFDQSGFYRVDPDDPRAEPFSLWLPTANGSYQQRCIRGVYEKRVMETIADHVDEDTVMWNIGAGQGYHSFPFAETVERVVCFEARESMVESLERGIEENGFDDVDVVPGYVGEDVFLDEFDPPDLVLIDAEGWEYEILESAPETLAAEPTWLVEVHRTETLLGGVAKPPELDPDGVIELFEENGYDVDAVEERENRDHVIATPTG